MIKPELLELCECTTCRGKYALQGDRLLCQECGETVPLLDSIPIFTPVAGEIRPSEKLARGPDTGTPWRRANWQFLQNQLAALPGQARILDVGAGRGDFAALLDRFQTIALDIYPYPEVNLVADLTQRNPFRPAQFDAVVLMNVLEHVYDTHTLLARLAELLKPGGILIIAIPFLVKLHQTPVDFVRYTHYALERFAGEHDLICETLEGYYDPLFFLSEGTGNIKNAYLPAIPQFKRIWARLLLSGLQTFANGLQSLLGPGQARSPEEMRSQAPTGYLLVYRKKLPEL
ncbi:MAG TPA: methyltransferase domain-containing protein [Anaerolineales bacterium]|nr:methyltransferase domain-containing protein [Anaerolineales bacterium]